MPQADPELRAEWWPADDPTGITTAIKFLEAAGYVLRDDWNWTAPKRRLEAKELRAVQYLIDEFDFGPVMVSLS